LAYPPMSLTVGNLFSHLAAFGERIYQKRRPANLMQGRVAEFEAGCASRV
jgi:hypothetical protein